MKPYLISIDEQVINDIKSRLKATRWIDEIDNDRWEAGTNKEYLQSLCDYWLREFDWKKQEQYLNTFQHFKTIVGKTGIHFILEKGKTENTVPILLIHGYPDSFVRFLKVIPMLTQGDENGFSFDVVVPSIPGYGFSDIPKEQGLNTKKIAGIFADLMESLGYEKFIVHGGDWGGSIAEQLGLYYEDRVIGLHLTDIPFHHAMMPIKDPTHAEKKFLEKKEMWQMTEGAYAMIQSTKPQTLAYGLNDSPAGLAAWLLEKFKSWSDNSGSVEDAISRDELLINMTIYWATQTINSSFRIYYETMKMLMNVLYNPLQKINPLDKTGKKSTPPAAFSLSPKDISSPPRDLAERFFNVHSWTEMPRGGHFAAMEEPELFVGQVRKFAKEISPVMNTRNR
jgi:pimeloyl-ACP methyl ester carboxylesterase